MNTLNALGSWCKNPLRLVRGLRFGRAISSVALLLVLFAIPIGCAGVPRTRAENETACSRLLGIACEYLVYRDRDGFSQALIAFVQSGGDAELRAALIFCADGRDEMAAAWYGDTIVSLLEVAGDETFARVLNSASQHVQEVVVDEIAKMVFYIDDEISYERARQSQSVTYPRTWVVVMDYLSGP